MLTNLHGKSWRAGSFLDPLRKSRKALESLGIEYETTLGGGLIVRKTINLSNRGLTELPDLSAVIVYGNFCCDGNQLTSLKGAPHTIHGGFFCYQNQLTSLEYAPQTVDGTFYCSENRLTTLEGAPQAVGEDFFCHKNQLVSLKGAPQTVGRGFSCCENLLTSLEYAPRSVGKFFYCSDNRLTTLKGAPESVGEDFFCYNNRLETLAGGPLTIGPDGDFSCTGNPLLSLQGMPTVFRRIASDFGKYASLAEVAADPRAIPLALVQKLSVHKPLRFRPRAPA